MKQQHHNLTIAAAQYYWINTVIVHRQRSLALYLPASLRKREQEEETHRGWTTHSGPSREDKWCTSWLEASVPQPLLRRSSEPSCRSMNLMQFSKLARASWWQLSSLSIKKTDTLLTCTQMQRRPIGVVHSRRYQRAKIGHTTRSAARASCCPVSRTRASAGPRVKRRRIRLCSYLSVLTIC
jgi:hypothetical protein